MQRTIQPARVEGSLSMPGDKSIAHRSLILAALAEGRSEIRGLPGSQDVKSTMRCLRTLGVQAGGEPGDELLSIEGRGLRGLSAPQFVLDAGNSGTTARMLLGVLAAQGFDASRCSSRDGCRCG
jgi:3-phosphoshikimate 1-carboxyvinyltransferase